MGEKRTSLFTLGDNEDVESSISEVANTASCKPPTMTNAKLPPAKRPLDRRRSDLASKKEAEPVMATMLKFSTPESNEQLKTDKFGVLKDFSVVTHRLIGQKIQNKMVETTTTRNLQGCLKRSSTEPSLEIPSEFLEKHQAETPKAARKPFKVPQQSGSKQPGFGDSGYGDRYTNQWDWPYPTKPIVKSTDDKFEAIIFYAPFTHEEVWVNY